MADWRMFAILDFRGPIMGSLKSQCATSYRLLIAAIALNCLVFEQIVFFLHFGNRQTNKLMDSTDPLSRCRERRFNNEFSSFSGCGCVYSLPFRSFLPARHWKQHTVSYRKPNATKNYLCTSAGFVCGKIVRLILTTFEFELQHTPTDGVVRFQCFNQWMKNDPG